MHAASQDVLLVGHCPSVPQVSGAFMLQRSAPAMQDVQTPAPVHIPVQGAPLFWNLPAVSQTCGCLSLQVIVPGTHLPAQAPFAQTKGQGAPLSIQTPAASQSCTWLPLHCVELGAQFFVSLPGGVLPPSAGGAPSARMAPPSPNRSIAKSSLRSVVHPVVAPITKQSAGNEKSLALRPMTSDIVLLRLRTKTARRSGQDGV
jgi:hypothetical protein